MANAMGGGGGVDGFRNLLKHIGPASKVWLEDMRAHAFVGDMENVEILCESVREELEGKNMKALEKQRDYELVGIFKLKRNAPPKPTNMANGAS
jgi:3-hydroxyacyl-CoA dehydrogenase